MHLLPHSDAADNPAKRMLVPIKEQPAEVGSKHAVNWLTSLIDG